MKHEGVTHIFSVRGRPVGFRPSRFGGELIATERGLFPVSPTGYRSLTGLFGGGPGRHEMVSAEFLEALAAERDREHQHLLKQLREGVKPVGQPVANYVHVSIAFEKAVQDGFFATDRERTALWNGAHQLLCMVDTDPRFQPAPEASYPAWNAKHCEASLAWARSLLGLLRGLAAGEMPERLPSRLQGPTGYLRLAPKPAGEPKIDLGGFTVEMPLAVAATVNARPMPPPVRQGFAPVSSERQLGLFDAMAASSVRDANSTSSRPRLSP